MNSPSNRVLKLLFLLFLLPFTAAGQAYVPMISTPDSSDVWTDVHSCSDFNCFTSETKRYSIDGDTVIGSFQYAKLQVNEKYEEGIAQSQSCPVGISYSSYYAGAVREDGKQIFFKPAGSPEYLAYDFNLSVGDTVPAPDNVSGFESMRIISSIDSVMVNGLYRKRYWVNPGSNPSEIIEGIGASTGLFNTLTDFVDCFSMMLCYKEDGAAQYFATDCNVVLALPGTPQYNPRLKLVKIVDCLGREIEDAPNTLMIYIYSDGRSKKVYRFE